MSPVLWPCAFAKKNIVTLTAIASRLGYLLDRTSFEKFKLNKKTRLELAGRVEILP